MARFLGDASGRTSAPYTDTQVNTACSNLCTYVNTVCSNIDTAKLSCTGCGSGVTGIVTSITAGSGVSVNQSTGTVTISASGGTGPVVLYNCGCWCGGCACIPSTSRGVFTRYEMMGAFSYGNYYCSQATFQFGGACSGACSPNNYGSNYGNRYCGVIASCGSIHSAKCFSGSYAYSCGGAIAWPFGCSSGCLTACTAGPFQYHVALTPVFPCCGSDRRFTYCFRTTTNGNYQSSCCYGIANSGFGCPCCGAHPACLQCICFTTPGASTNQIGSLVVVGYGKLTV